MGKENADTRKIQSLLAKHEKWVKLTHRHYKAYRSYLLESEHILMEVESLIEKRINKVLKKKD